MSRVCVSLPLRGPTGEAGRELLRGVQLARRSVELMVLDSSGADRDALAGEHARVAIGEPDALAMIGGFHSSQVMATAHEELLFVSPSATYSGLAGDTLVRLMPDDRALARAIAHWLDAAGVRRLLIVHDHDDGYGVPVARTCVEAVRAEVRSRPVWDWDEDMTADVGDAEAVLYVGVAGSGAVGLWDGLHALNERLWLLGTDGVAHPGLAHDMGAGAAARTRFFSTRHAPWGFFGYEAMALVEDAIATGGDRAGVVRHARSARGRESVLGRYSLDEHGLTTSAAYAALEVRDGEIVWSLP
jgi:ABC-type branched-subunit amino acid transport system substrate-binding protein